jgi:hypothetical protein
LAVAAGTGLAVRPPSPLAALLLVALAFGVEVAGGERGRAFKVEARLNTAEIGDPLPPPEYDEEGKPEIPETDMDLFLNFELIDAGGELVGENVASGGEL